MDKMGQNFHKIEAVRLEGGDPPSPPKAVSLTAFFPFFFITSLRGIIKKAVRLTAWGGGGGVTPLQPDRFYFVKILTHFILYKMAK